MTDEPVSPALRRASEYAAIFNSADRPGGRGWRFYVPVDGVRRGRGAAAVVALDGCVISRGADGLWHASETQKLTGAEWDR